MLRLNRRGMAWLCSVLLLVLNLGLAHAQDNEESYAEPVDSPPETIQTLVIALPVLSDISIDASVNMQSYLKSYWIDWSKKFGYRVEFKVLSQEAAFAALKEDRVQIVAAVLYEAARMQEVYYSIPFLDMYPDVYHYTPSTEEGAIKIAAHYPKHADLIPLNSSVEVVSRSKNIESLLEEPINYNYLYSWMPQDTDKMLKKMGTRNLYQKTDIHAHALKVRAMTSRNSKDLMRSINKGFLTLDLHNAQKQWNKYFGEDISSVRNLLGNYFWPLTMDQQEFLIDSPVVSYAATSAGYPPYLISSEFAVHGYVVELLSRVSDRVGLQFLPRYFDTFPDSVTGLHSSETDLLAGIYKTVSRESKMLFSQPIDTSLSSIVSNRQHDFTSIKDAITFRIAVVRGYYETQLLEERFPSHQLVYVDSVDEALIAISEGRAEAHVGHSSNIAYLLADQNLDHLVINKLRDFDIQKTFHISAGKDDQQLIEIINLGLNSLGEMSMTELKNNWLNSVLNRHAGESEWPLYQRIALVAATVFIVVILMILLMRAEFKRRNAVQLKIESALAAAESARQKSEQLSYAKSDFLARMSHEIRTPMNGVFGMAEALSYTRLDADQKDLLGTLNHSAHNLMSLLNDVLDFSKMEAGKLSLEARTFTLRTLLDDVVANFQHKSSSQGVELGLKVDERLASNYRGDVVRLMQVLNNLVSNAVKFTGQGSVEVSALLIDEVLSSDAADKQRHAIRLSVRDSGIGIDKAKQAALFDPFTQAEDDITRRFGGTGLGLSICKEIVELMEGDIRVSSVPGHGSLFTIDLVWTVCDELVEPITSVQPKNEAASPAALAPLKVLLAEDNAVNRKVLGHQLSSMGVVPDMAVNGLEAYNLYKEGDYDVIISDCHMPEMSGFTLASKVSAERTGNRPQLIAMTADALSGAAQECYDAGFDEYLSKPSTREAIYAKLVDSQAVLGLVDECASDAAEWTAAPADEDQTEIIAEEPQPAAADVDALISLDSGASDIGLEVIPPDGSYLERGSLLELAEGDVEVIADLLDEFLSCSETDRQLMQTALADGEMTELKSLAHRFKGSLGYVGASSLVDVAQRLELTALTGDDNNIQSLTEALERGLAALHVEVSVWVDEIKTSSAKELS